VLANAVPKEPRASCRRSSPSLCIRGAPRRRATRSTSDSWLPGFD